MHPLSRIAAALLTTLPVFAAQADSPAQQYGLALEAQTAGDYPRMLSLLQSAAGAGHAPAQQTLGLALLGGPALYGQAIASDPCAARHWLARAARAQGDAPPAVFARPRAQLPACQP
ncbi:hypothetical protein [Bordetella bronchiseptica]|uniref:Exported protein n=2 Tax=Bordetella bronchiseptica TaxID=518 RepID=A0A0H3LJ61_BORBR|nr:hypothetical protein [Bordetella bronchiseptica]KAK66349.1 hypothetical protein AZ22_1035 [Bordetella bronchiseptica 980-2]AMG87702.1 hypothetical protein AL472_07665 [Bordetella bronchiseptica]KCV52399.1 hypothetical protein L491_1268 [Bordetella bronchiseptica 3E44]KCV61723.1 hypothetical protein AZ14_1160 [Bordetella bronchiseptica 980]KDB88336.1 hypothetical protein AZ27_1281 [Bordetella bronchiseptica D756]